MYDIIPLVEIDHEPRVDSRLIAEQLGIQHQNFRELIQDTKPTLRSSEYSGLKPEKSKGEGNPRNSPC